MKMLSEFLKLLHEDGWTEIYKATERHFRRFFSLNHANSHTVNVYCCRLLLTKRHNACRVQRLTAQHIYCTSTVQNVQSTTELYLQ
jgi:hypothetical protein